MTTSILTYLSLSLDNYDIKLVIISLVKYNYFTFDDNGWQYITFVVYLKDYSYFGVA